MVIEFLLVIVIELVKLNVSPPFNKIVSEPDVCAAISEFSFARDANGLSCPPVFVDPGVTKVSLPDVEK